MTVEDRGPEADPAEAARRRLHIRCPGRGGGDRGVEAELGSRSVAAHNGERPTSPRPCDVAIRPGPGSYIIKVRRSFKKKVANAHPRAAASTAARSARWSS